MIKLFFILPFLIYSAWSQDIISFNLQFRFKNTEDPLMIQQERMKAALMESWLKWFEKNKSFPQFKLQQKNNEVNNEKEIASIKVILDLEKEYSNTTKDIFRYRVEGALSIFHFKEQTTIFARSVSAQTFNFQIKEDNPLVKQMANSLYRFLLPSFSLLNQAQIYRPALIQKFVYLKGVRNFDEVILFQQNLAQKLGRDITSIRLEAFTKNVAKISLSLNEKNVAYFENIISQSLIPERTILLDKKPDKYIINLK